MADERTYRGKRVVFVQPRQVELRDVEEKSPPPGRLLVRTIATTISTGTELTILSGEYPPGSKWAEYARYPFNAGYSNCGEVVELGEGVEGLEVGQRVVSYTPHACYVALAPDQVMAVVPEAVSAEEASTFALGLIATNGVRRARLELGESVVVYGLGVLGLLVVQLARLSGCRPVIGVDLAPQRLGWARELGADATVNAAEEDVPARVEELTKGRKADVLFEVTGNPAIIEDEFRVLRRFGRAVILSSPRGKTPFDFHDYCNSPSITIIGAHNGSTPRCETVFSQWTWPRNCELYLDFLASGELKVKDMITHRFAAEEAPGVYQRLLEDRGWAGFIVLEW